MAYREVTILEVKEGLRLRLGGVRKKRIAAQLGLDVKTVRRYVAAAEASGLTREAGLDGLTEARLAAVIGTVQPATGRPHGDGWTDLCRRRAVIIACRAGAARRGGSSLQRLPTGTLHHLSERHRRSLGPRRVEGSGIELCAHGGDGTIAGVAVGVRTREVARAAKRVGRRHQSHQGCPLAACRSDVCQSHQAHCDAGGIIGLRVQRQAVLEKARSTCRVAVPKRRPPDLIEPRRELTLGVAQQGEALVTEHVLLVVISVVVRGQGKAHQRFRKAKPVVHLAKACHAVLVEAPGPCMVPSVVRDAAEAPQRDRDRMLVAELLSKLETLAI
jgi:hypothetical protein